MIRKWFDKKVLILGLSKSGTAAAKYLNSKGADCFITEKKPLADKDKALVEELNALGIKTEFEHHSEEFMTDVYIAVTSPGIPPQSELMQLLKEKNIKVISEIELAYLETQTPFIAITGTNGKTTTTELTNFIINKEFRAEKCGNIGIPPCSLITNNNKEIDFLVCEVSSFQLHYSPSFRPQIAVWTNFTPDHIDWHSGLDGYFEAKASLFSKEKKPAFAIFNAEDEKLLEFGKNYNGEKFFFGKEFDTNCSYIKNGAIYFKRRPKNEEEKIIDIKDIPLVGNHNYQNVMVSLICAKIEGVSTEKIVEAIKEFKAPEHRCEFTGNILGKDVYNDSKATNPEASIFALKSFEGKTLTLIAGGTDKMTDLTEFCETVKKYVNKVVLLGAAKDRFETELRKNGYNEIIIADTFTDGVDKAFESESEVILLSPACASYDMFTGYEERGRVFKEYALSKKK